VGCSGLLNRSRRSRATWGGWQDRSRRSRTTWGAWDCRVGIGFHLRWKSDRQAAKDETSFWKSVAHAPRNRVLLRSKRRHFPRRCGRSLTEPPGRPKVSNFAGDLRSAVSAGSETVAERRKRVLLRSKRRHFPRRCGRSLTEPPGRPKVSNFAGDLRSAVSAGSETLAERRKRVLLRSKRRHFPRRCGRSLTEPPGRPKVSNFAGDLRSAVSAGSETLAERRKRVLLRSKRRHFPRRCGRSLTEPPGRPKVSNFAGDLRAAVSAGSETLAERRKRVLLRSKRRHFAFFCGAKDDTCFPCRSYGPRSINRTGRRMPPR
jgi:hypothetical protein